MNQFERVDHKAFRHGEMEGSPACCERYFAAAGQNDLLAVGATWRCDIASASVFLSARRNRDQPGSAVKNKRYLAFEIHRRMTDQSLALPCEAPMAH